MTKVYPRTPATAAANPTSEKLKLFPELHGNKNCGDEKSVSLTVWKKSLLFNCDGFTVFDGKGNLVFRVDNYSAATKGEITLMDPSGNPLLTIRRKRLSMADNWMVYEGETTANPILSAKKHVSLLSTRSLAHVSSATKTAYEVEGSYARRCCTVRDQGRKAVVAEIKRKEAATRGAAFGLDVFRLIVHPGMDAAVAMAVVIMLDQMFSSPSFPLFG